MASLVAHFQMLARYNTLANERLYAACAGLDDAEYRRERPASFGSLHRTLNHLLLGDRIWLGRFTSEEVTATPPLDTELYPDFASLRAARVAEDARLEAFVAALTDAFLAREIRYVNNQGVLYSDPVPLLLAHLFNHQAHHRGQAHSLLSAAGVRPPSLDMHRALRPKG